MCRMAQLGRHDAAGREHEPAQAKLRRRRWREGRRRTGDEFGRADSLDRFVGTIQEEGEASLPAPLAEFAVGLAPRPAR